MPLRHALTALLFASTLTSCGPELTPLIRSVPLPITELIQQSEAIVVGTITSMKLGGKTYAGGCLVLVRVRVAVENVLTGEVPSPVLDYYYFGPWCGTAGALGSPTPNSRNVFFLRKEHGYWRTIADYYGNLVQVRSGRHSSQVLKGKTVEQAIAEVLLTPGEGYFPESFAYAVGFEAAHEAWELVGSEGTRRLLAPLLNHSDNRVRVGACIALAEDGVRGCADRILTPYLDKFERWEFQGITRAFIPMLQTLAAYSDPGTRARAQTLLPVARLLANLPGKSPAPVPQELR